MKPLITQRVIAQRNRTRTSLKRDALAALWILSLLCVCKASAKERQWQTGTLLGVYENNVDARSLKAVDGIKAAPKDLVNDTYTIDAGKYIYQAAELRKSKHQPPPFTVNGPLQFAIEGEHVYLKDSQGREHDTKLVVRRRKAGDGA
jgi:hypothetical protein